MTTPTVLITGALSGIGRATAHALAREGANVVVSGRSEGAGARLVDELRAAGAQAIFIKADVRHEDDVRALVDATVAQFGRLDAAINNAGTEGAPGAITEQSAASYAATFDTNVLGVLLSLKHEIRVMAKQGAGSIVNVSSILGKVGFGGASVYAASKHAVEGLTKSVALEVATQGIRVNAVAPGPIDTGMLDRFTGNDPAAKQGMGATMPLQRVGRPEEVAQAIVFLALSKSGYITGHSLSVDGGAAAD
jgi:NAD(P)-dependent dehydrogenase (short-subunit alcohol dehydrogenase family)